MTIPEPHWFNTRFRCLGIAGSYAGFELLEPRGTTLWWCIISR